VASKIDAERQAAGIGQPSRAVSLVLDAATRPEGLSYAGIKKLRSYIGEMVDNPSLIPADLSQGEVKQIYGALSKDMKGIVEKAGGKDAVGAWDAANVEAQNAAEVRDNLARVLKAPSEEAIFDKITAMTGTTSRGDVTTLGQARTAVGDKNWGEVLSAMVERWGFDEQGNFQPQQFFDRWNKVTKDAKEVLFKTDAEKRQMQALDDIATVSAKADDLARLAEPKKGGVVKGALGLGGASALLGVSVSPWTAIVPILGSRVISNVLAKPEGAPAFATWAKAYVAFVSSPSQGHRRGAAEGVHALAYRVAVEQGLDHGPAAATSLAQARQHAGRAGERRQGEGRPGAAGAHRGPRNSRPFTEGRLHGRSVHRRNGQQLQFEPAGRRRHAGADERDHAGTRARTKLGDPLKTAIESVVTNVGDGGRQAVGWHHRDQRDYTVLASDQGKTIVNTARRQDDHHPGRGHGRVAVRLRRLNTRPAT
jgi:hypothetical protein